MLGSWRSLRESPRIELGSPLNIIDYSIISSFFETHPSVGASSVTGRVSHDPDVGLWLGPLPGEGSPPPHRAPGKGRRRALLPGECEYSTTI